MAIINPYLNFKGNAEEAFIFYKSVFGGEFSAVQRFGDNPGMGKVSESDKRKLMHIALPVGNGNVLMASDVIESDVDKFTPGNDFQLSIHAESKQEADRIYNALVAGGKKTLAMATAPWGDYFGMLTDKFGIQWMMSFRETTNQEQSKEKQAEVAHH